MFNFFHKKNIPKPPATLEYAVSQGIISVEEMLWIKKERAIEDYETIKETPKKTRKSD